MVAAGEAPDMRVREGSEVHSEPVKDRGEHEQRPELWWSRRRGRRQSEEGERSEGGGQRQNQQLL